MSSKDEHIVESIVALAREFHETHVVLKDGFEMFRSHHGLATKQDLIEMETRIMSAISDFGDAVNAKFDELGTSVDGIAGDVDFLKAEIKKLQDNPGPITPADQAILDGVQSRVAALGVKVKALDDATAEPPTPPPA